MNPTLNKKDFEDLTTNLKDLAYNYLEKYSPSKQQLKVYLLKKYLTKIKGTKSKREVSDIIDEIINHLEKNKIIDDELFADSKARMFLRRGYSINKINLSLRNKGVKNDLIKKSIDKIKENNIEPDFVSALKLCKKRRIGAIRPQANRELFYKKDMGILARGGFSFELSKRVLDLEEKEFYKLIKII
jgi:regulatory protein|tara:strand:- start:988 stop:1548 length:561 start_codon:yes stop_codon:yes gene_type:complete